jgi:transcription antitermination protein NusB
MGARRKGRILAFQTLYAYELCSVGSLQGRSGVNEAEGQSLEFSWIDVSNMERINQESIDFARLIAAGTIQNLNEIDGQIKTQLEHWDFSRINKVDQALLRIGVYSLLFQKDIPASVTIDEAVDISKEYGTDESYRFVNGVLDGIRKNLER